MPRVLRIRPGGHLGRGPGADIGAAISPAHADLILAAQERGTTEDEPHELVADAYFRRDGGGRSGVEVEFKDVEWLDIKF